MGGHSSKNKHQHQHQLKHKNVQKVEEELKQRYKVVPLQKLEPHNFKKFRQMKELQIVSSLQSKLKNEGQQQDSWEEQSLKLKDKNPSKKYPTPYQLYWFQDNSNSQKQKTENNTFFSAFLSAYNAHGNILLIPDDIWITIMLYLSKYINNNSQKLRQQFVKHEGQKQLTVYEFASSVEQSLAMQKKWDTFFNSIIDQIRKNTNEGVVEQLKCDFSTTTQLYEVISTSIIMGSFKNYFNYNRCITKCGISNVYFDGTLEDWNKLKKKLNNLVQYDVDGTLIKYVKAVDMIIDKFIETYKGKVDLKWWNQIISLNHPNSGAVRANGWLLNFFGVYSSIDFDDIPDTYITVPIKLINQLTNTTKNLELITDWTTISKVDQRTCKPDIGLAIFERKQSDYHGIMNE